MMLYLLYNYDDGYEYGEYSFTQRSRCNDLAKIILCRPDLTPVAVLNGVQPDSVSYSEHTKDFDELDFTVDRYIRYNTSIDWGFVYKLPNGNDGLPSGVVSSGNNEYSLIDKNGDILTTENGQTVLFETLTGKSNDVNLRAFRVSNGYQYLDVYMYVYVQGIGFFQLQYPTVQNDGIHQKKICKAYSIEKELMDKDWLDLKINTAQPDSLQCLVDGNVDDQGFPIDYITFYNPYNPKLSLLDILLEKVPDWKIGYVSGTLTTTYDSSGNMIQGKSIGRYQEDNINLYAFLTATLGPKIECLFTFDTSNRMINAYDKDDLQFNTNIYIGFRNLINSVELTVDQDSVITRLRCYGDNELTIRNVNYGSDQLVNLDYFVQQPWMTEELAEKVKTWLKARDDNRSAYKAAAIRSAELYSQIQELIYRVPSDDLNLSNFKSANKTELQQLMWYYEAVMATWQVQIDHADGSKPQTVPGTSSNIKGNYTQVVRPIANSDASHLVKVYHPKETLKNSSSTAPSWFEYDYTVDHQYYLTNMKDNPKVPGYYTYYQIVTYIIPNIVTAANILQAQANGYTDYDIRHDEQLQYLQDWESNWDLYGTQELQNKKASLSNQVEILQKQYSREWNKMDPDDRAEYSHLDAVYQISHSEYVEAYVKLYGIDNFLADVAKSGAAPVGSQKYNELKQKYSGIKCIQTKLDQLYAKLGKEDSMDETTLYGKYNIAVKTQTDMVNPVSPYYTDSNGNIVYNFEFTQEDMKIIRPLLIDTDYTNTNILSTSIDTAQTEIEHEQQLFDDSCQKLSELAQPQMKFQISLDNLMRLPQFQQWIIDGNEEIIKEFGDELTTEDKHKILTHREVLAPQTYTENNELWRAIRSYNINVRKEFSLLRYIWVGIRDDYSLKLRVVGITYNPCQIEPDLQIEFSNMISSRSGRTDFTDILQTQNQRSAKNSVGIGTGDSTKELQYMTAMLSKLGSSGALNGIVNNAIQSSIPGIAVTIDEMGISTVRVQNIVGNEASFNRFFSKYIGAGVISADMIASDSITTDKLQAGAITADKIASHTITADQLSADQGAFSSLLANNITASTIRTGLLQTNHADINTLLAKEGVVFNLTTNNSTVDAAFARRIIANNVVASDITAGDINLSNGIRILTKDEQGNDGSLIMGSRGLQIWGTYKEDVIDSQGNDHAAGQKYCGIQLGFDTTDQPSLVIRNQKGSTILTPQGITAHAIAEQLIVNDMIKTNTITKDRLGFNIIEPNDQGGIDITNIYDGNGNLWGIEYASFKNTVNQEISNTVPYKMTIESSNGLFFDIPYDTVEEEGIVRHGWDTTLEARLFRGSTDITNANEQTFVGNNSTLVYTLTKTPKEISSITIDNVSCTKYELNGKTITLETYPGNNSSIVVTYISQEIYSETFLGDGNTKTFTLINIPDGCTELKSVIVNNEEVLDAIYIPSESKLEFTTAPPSKSSIVVIYPDNVALVPVSSYEWKMYDDQGSLIKTWKTTGTNYLVVTDRDFAQDQIRGTISCIVSTQKFGASSQISLTEVADGVSIVKIVTQYRVTNSIVDLQRSGYQRLRYNDSDFPLWTQDGELIQKDDGWYDEIPENSGGQYIWTRIRTYLSDGNVYSSYTITKNGEQLSTVTELYYCNQSDTEYPDPQTTYDKNNKDAKIGWTSTPPDYEEGYYLWVCSLYSYASGLKFFTVPHCDYSWKQLGDMKLNFLDQENIISTIQQLVDKESLSIDQRISQTIYSTGTDIQQVPDPSPYEGKWHVKIYNKSKIPENARNTIALYPFFDQGDESITPTYQEYIYDMDPSRYTYTSDEPYVGYALVFVQVIGQDKEFPDIGFTASSKGSVFVNGIQSISTISSFQPNGKIMLKRGWNMIEVVWNSGINNRGLFKFSDKFSYLTQFGAINGRQFIVTNRVSTTRSKFSQIYQDLNVIYLSVGDIKKDDEGNIISLQSQITQNADSITSTVSKLSDGNFLSSTINQTADRVLIQAQKVDLIGKVTMQMFESTTKEKIQDAFNASDTVFTWATVAEAEKTVIRGGRVDTGLINANYLVADAIASKNYTTNSSDDKYTSTGIYIDLTGNGSIHAKNFAITSDGSAYFKGTITAGANSKIGPWNVTETSIYNNKSSLTANSDGVYIGTDGISLGPQSTFKVTNTGELTATSATITGTITAGANSKIGPWNVTSTSIYNSKSSLTANANGVYIGTDGLSIGPNSTFKVTNAGVLTASSATITGTITAGANSKIGPWSISDTAIYLNKNTYGASGGVYFGTSGLSLGDKFKVDANGNATISGTLSAGSGSKIGPWTVTNSSIYNAKPSLTSNTNGVYIGTDGISLGPQSTFKVTNTGALTATDVSLSGTLRTKADNHWMELDMGHITGGIGTSTYCTIDVSTQAYVGESAPRQATLIKSDVLCLDCNDIWIKYKSQNVLYMTPSGYINIPVKINTSQAAIYYPDGSYQVINTIGNIAYAQIQVSNGMIISKIQGDGIDLR